VVRVQTGVRELDPIGELGTDRDRLLRLVRHSVVPVLEAESVPVHGGVEVAVVVTCTTISEPCRTLRVGPGTEPL
jgi:hypothetical protein